MDRLARLIVWLAFCCPFCASAAVTYTVTQFGNGSTTFTGSGGTVQAAADAWAANLNSANWARCRDTYGNVLAKYTVVVTGVSGTTVSYTLSAPAVPNASGCAAYSSSGTTTAVQSGTCPDGESQDGSGACHKVCPTSGTQLAGMGTVFEAGNGLTSTVCLAGCEASAFMAARQDGKNYVWGPISATGKACTQGPAGLPSTSQASPQCGVGQCPGTLNGQTICVPCSESKQDTKASSSETAASAASGAAPGPGQTTTQSGSSSTTCAGDTCTTTGQQTVQNPDGSTETKTTTTTQSKGDYCKENPKAGACVGSESTWGGTCQAFTCDGDAVQCAQARGAWELACQLKTEATDPAVQAGTDAIAQTGEASIKDQLGMNTSQVFDLASRLDSTSLFGTPGACPSDTVLPLGIGSVTLPFASMCSQLNLVGVAMMGLAYLIAAFIVFRPGKGA